MVKEKIVKTPFFGKTVLNYFSLRRGLAKTALKFVDEEAKTRHN